MFRIIVVGLAVAFAVKSQGEIIGFKFSGTIVDTDISVPAFGNSITNGTPFTGFYTFETTTPDASVATDVGDYRHTNSAFGVAVKVGNHVFRTNPDQVDFLLETVNRPGRDNYLFRSYVNLPTAGEFVEHIEWQLYDDSGTAWTNDALPTVPPNLDAFANGHDLEIYGPNFIIRGPVESISVIPTTISNAPAATILPAVEVSWPAQLGYFYQVQESTNMVTWSNRGEPIMSLGDPISVFVQQKPGRMYFRLIVTNHGP